MPDEFKFLGKRSTAPTKELDKFETPPYVTEVEIEAFELTSFCPVTEQPDFSTVVVTYCPKKWCLETKSFKLYLWSFREERIFGEGLASQIAQDIFNAIEPSWIEVELKQSIRGGMQLTAKANI